MQEIKHPRFAAETYISVDVETSGPNPSSYDLLSIGACLADKPEVGFYVELQPATGNAIPGALAISRLSIEQLAETGVPPAVAMQQFDTWVRGVVPEDHRAVFVALNAPFDWMFVNDYFHRYLRFNPFGHSALDIKAFYMGLAGVHWSQTSMQVLSSRYLRGRRLTHNALQDARDQAEVFGLILAEATSHICGAASRRSEP